MELEEFKCDVCPHKQKWIPVREKMPKDWEKVLICQESGEVNTGAYSEKNGIWLKGDFNSVGGSDVIAWMPLPEPYKEEGDQDG